MIISGLDDENSFIGWVESRRGCHNFSVSTVREAGSRFGLVDIQSLVVDEELGEILLPMTDKSWFREKLEKFKSVKALAIGIQNYVNEVTADQTQADLNESSLPQLLMKHLDDVGWDRVTKVNEDLTVIQMRSLDFTGRAHIFDVLIHPGYPVVSPTVQATLPMPVVIPWTPHSDLRLVIAVVDKEVKRYENLFDELSEIDSKTWVLEPVQPTFGTSSRRLAVERSCSIVLDLKVDNPRDMCTINFFGPPSRVNIFRLSLSRNTHLWSRDRSVKMNIELMLGFILPCKSTDSAANDNLCEECGICYTYSIGVASDPYGDSSHSKPSSSAYVTGKEKKATTNMAAAASVPEQACGNTKCCKIYHFSCLVDWLQSLPSSKTSFGTLFGCCPYCQEAISVRIQR